MPIVENFGFNPALAHFAVTKSGKRAKTPLAGISLTAWKPKTLYSLLPVLIILFSVGAIFQTLAWYHNVDGTVAFWTGFAVSMVFVFFEYLFTLPANALGVSFFNLVQLGIFSELLAWIVFVGYVKYVRKDEISRKCWFGLGVMLIGVIIAYAG